MDTIANNPQFIEKIFQVLLPYDEENLCKYQTADLPNFAPEVRRVPLTCAENFCRLIFTLIKQQSRFYKVLQFLYTKLEIMTWFVYSIQSAAITETLHYIFKIDKNPEITDLQAKIILDSQFIQNLYGLFLKNGIFEELVHVAFIFQSFLTTEMKSDVKKMIMTCLPSVINEVLTPTANTSLVKNIYTIIAITLKQAVRMGILSETIEDAQIYAEIVRDVLLASCPKFVTYLQMQILPEKDAPQNLYIVHTCTVISEIIKIQEAEFEFIRDKENLLLNHQYAPEQAIQYLTDYYR